MKSFFTPLVLFVSLLCLMSAGRLEWQEDSESGAPITKDTERKNLPSSDKKQPLRPPQGMMRRQKGLETTSPDKKSPRASKTTSWVATKPSRHDKPNQTNSNNITNTYRLTSAGSRNATYPRFTNATLQTSKLTSNTSPTSTNRAGRATVSNIESITSRPNLGASVSPKPTANMGLDSSNYSWENNTRAKSRAIGNKIVDPGSTVSSDAAQSTSNSAATNDAISNPAATTSGAQPTSSSTTGVDDAPPYNLNNVACKDYWSMTSSDKWNFTDGDSTVQTFVDMFTSDKLFCEDCFGQLKSQCDSTNVTCKYGVRTRATPDPKFGPSWSVAAAWFAQYGKADHFICQLGTENECAHAPECKDCDGGEGAGAAALLEALSNIFISFKENYDAISRAGDLCDMQMKHFSDVFAPVPDSESGMMGLIVLSAMLGGLAGFLTGGAGAFAGLATGLGSGIGMEKYFASRPGPSDTSSSLGIIVGNVLDVYGNMTNQLFHDGEFQHPTSDGKSSVDISLAGLMADGNAMTTDSDPHSHFTGLIPTYMRLFFQQLALITWQHLEADQKTHVPFIAFDKGPCDQVDPKQETSVASHKYMEGIDKLDSRIDFQGDCYYLLDANPEMEMNPDGVGGPICRGNHHLPGGTHKSLQIDNVDTFKNLSLEDFIIPSVLGWQNHSKTNGYESSIANGNLVDDPQAPGVVNIPVCDYVADKENPGVGCPLINKSVINRGTKCQLVSASQGNTQPGQYQQGKCRAHVTQWQKNEVQNNANQLPDYQLSVDIFDQAGRQTGSATKQDAAKPLEVGNTALPYDLIVVPGATDDDPVSFWYADQYWMSNETDDPHKCHGGGGQGGGGGYDHGFRQIDCGFDCPLKDPDTDPPASATIAHPLPATPIGAVPGLSSYANTYSKPVPAAATAAPDYASGVCGMKITQYQRNEKTKNPTNDYQLEISVKDSTGKLAASLPKEACPSGKPVVMHGLKGGDFTVTVGMGDTDVLKFNYNGQDFDTKSLKCGIGGYEKGDREMNCNINC
ncbi:MAG: hypothetical protein Q9170_007407 [Blastenia crenularia]